MPFPRPRKADFPRVEDLAGAPEVDAYDAARALSVLWRLCQMNLARVYHPHMAGIDTGPWAVWLEITQRHVELEAWVREWLASQEEMDGPDGGDAA